MSPADYPAGLGECRRSGDRDGERSGCASSRSVQYGSACGDLERDRGEEIGSAGGDSCLVGCTLEGWEVSMAMGR